MRKNLPPKRSQIAHLTSASKSGFTIIELSLTMTFVAVLLITIVIVTMNIVAIYQKGLTIKAVNSVGRSLVDEITSAVNAAPSVDTTSLCRSLLNDPRSATAAETAEINKCVDDHADLYIFQENRGLADHIGESGAEQVQYNGVFCTGRYSYLWNTYYGIENNKTISVTYLNSDGTATTIPDGSDDSRIQARLVRFEDRTYRLCSAVMEPGKYRSNFASFTHNLGSTTNNIDITKLIDEVPNPIPTPVSGLLDEFDLDLALYDLKLFPISQDSVTLRTFMSGTFVLGTLRGSIDITRSGDYCREDIIQAAEESSGDNLGVGAEFNYCAINKFNFATRTAGMKGN